MFKVPSSRVIFSIALLLIAGQLIASVACSSPERLSDEAEIIEAEAEADGSDGTQNSAQQPEQNGRAPSGFKLIKFDAFQARFGKHYTSMLERVFRLRQFLANVARVSRSNLAYLNEKSPYFLRINRFSDLTRDERRKKYGERPDSEILLAKAGDFDTSNSSEEGRVLSRQKRGLFGRGKKELKPLEFELDWRRREEREPKCLNEPELDQGDCGCCYAMAMMRLFEWLHCRRHGRPIKLSEQYLVDCGQEHGLTGCQHGNLLGALNFISASGVMRAEELPFAGEEQTCPSDAHERAIKVQRVQRRVVRERQKWASELAKAPLVVYLSLSDDFFDYGGGLFELRNCEPDEGHFMLLAGHGRDPNHNERPFFLLSNSFGPNFGESGYIRLAADRVGRDCLTYAMGAEADF